MLSEYIGNEMTISGLAKESHQTAVEHGWWPEDGQNNFMEKLMLVVSEVSEAGEEYRKHGFADDKMIYLEGEKPEGIAVELADAVIRIVDLCGYWNIPLEEALKQKLAYNKTRPFRHGGKIC